MSKTLREKLCDCHNVGVPCGEEVIAKHIDALSTRLDGAIADGLARLEKLERTDNEYALPNIENHEERIGDLEEKHEDLVKAYQKLERDLTAPAGADVPSAPGEFIRPDEPDLEGEAMSPDYEADRDEAEEPDRPCGQLGPKGIDWKPNENSCLGEPDRPWREAAEACWEALRGIWHNRPGDECIDRIESAIEKAVEKTEWERNEEAWARSGANVALQMSELEARKLTWDVREMKAERDALKAEVAELKAAKPKVVGLDRVELFECFVYPPQGEERFCSRVNVWKTIETILDTQAKKAAEIEGEVSDTNDAEGGTE